MPVLARLWALAGLAAVFASPALAADCAPNEPWGVPGVTDGHQIMTICHAGYAAGLDSETREPRWVAYELTAPHTLGCYPRTGLTFKVDDLAPAEDQGRKQDYSGSGYDLGHMAPNEDFAWSKVEQRQSFSFANVAPQLPGLNRQGWERLEEYVRAWALTRGDLEIYVGPVYAGNITIGVDKLPVPSAFFKVVIDRRTNEAMGFVMPQEAIKKGPVAPWRIPISDIQAKGAISLPLPARVIESTETWSGDLKSWAKKHKAQCG